MAEFPALTLWTDSYLSDTRTLTTLEHGAYLLLLMEAWRRPHCDLPDDDALLARMAGLSREEWEEIKAIILGFWTLDGRSKTWKQKRLTKERDAARKRSKSQRDKATKRWNKTESDNAAADAQECPDDASTATATATKSSVETDVSTAAGASELDDPDDQSGGGEAAPDKPPALSAADITKAIFDTGVGLLKASGKSDPQARSMIGMWRKNYSDGLVLTAISRCEAAQPPHSNPIEWITKALQSEQRKAAGNGYGNHSPRDNRDGLTRAVDRRLGLGGDERPARETG